MDRLHKYHSYFFIGARGHLHGLEFEIIGWGEVNYTVGSIIWDEDEDEIGKTFPTYEYYCLATNGERWFFSISNEEIHVFIQTEPVTDNIIRSKSLKVLESGAGMLVKGEGRALHDTWDYSEFEYRDIGRNEDTIYTNDIFPNGENDWFTVHTVREKQLPDIFNKTLALQAKSDPELHEFLNKRKRWKFITKLGIASLILLFVLFVGNFIVFLFTPLQTYSRKLVLEATTGSETSTEFPDLPEGRYDYEIIAKTPLNLGSSINISWQNQDGTPITNENVEFFSYNLGNYSNTTNSVTGSFYDSTREGYRLVFRLNDYDAVEIDDSINKYKADESTYDLNQPIPIEIKISRFNLYITPWIQAVVIISVITIFSYTKN